MVYWSKKNLPNPSHGYGFVMGMSQLTRTCTHHTCTRVPMWVCKPMMGTMCGGDQILWEVLGKGPTFLLCLLIHHIFPISGWTGDWISTQVQPDNSPVAKAAQRSPWCNEGGSFRVDVVLCIMSADHHHLRTRVLVPMRLQKLDIPSISHSTDSLSLAFDVWGYSLLHTLLPHQLVHVGALESSRHTPHFPCIVRATWHETHRESST